MAPDVRSEQFMLRLTPAELKALKRVADKSGLSAADVVRQLIRERSSMTLISAWVRHEKRCDPHVLFRERPAPNYFLLALRDITATDRVFRLLNPYQRPVPIDELLSSPWFETTNNQRFVLEASPKPWKIVTIVQSEITLSVDEEYPPA